jgi:hypothetical protein
MRTLAFVILSTFALAACDAPDPSAFHHGLRSDAMTGSRLNGAIGAGEVGSTDEHGVEFMQRQGDINTRK